MIPVLDSARGLYGAYQKCMSIYNLPFNLMVPLTASIIPAVSAARARCNDLEARKVSGVGPTLCGAPGPSGWSRTLRFG